MLLKQSHILTFFGLALLFSCIASPKTEDKPYVLTVPEGFSLTKEQKDSLTHYKVKIGKRLFSDKNLSLNKQIACITCHQPNFAFADNQAISRGVNNRLGNRNAPSLYNVAYKPHFFMDGGIPTLEMQVAAPIEDTNEMAFDFLAVVNYMQNDSVYRKWSQIAYNRNPDAFVLTRSLAAFQRTLVSGNAIFDKEKRGEIAFTASQQRGKELFYSDKTKCSKCHSGSLFTDYKYYAIGLPISKSDSGRMRITGKEEDRDKYVVPSLRNVALTAPYMHDGSMATLAKVITLFNTGGLPHANKSKWIKPLHLSENEKQDLIHFLETLTDNSIAENYE